jgi:hypothetical protein
MKKADLLKELQGIVELNLMIVEEHLSTHAIEVIAKAMLSHAETRGMLPPTHQVEVGTGYANSEGGELTEIIEVAEWEDVEEDWG